MIVKVTYIHWLDKYELESVIPDSDYIRSDGKVISPSQFNFSYPSGFVIFGQKLIEMANRKQRFKVIINLDKDFSKIENVMIYKVSQLVKSYLRERKIEELGIL